MQRKTKSTRFRWPWYLCVKIIMKIFKGQQTIQIDGTNKELLDGFGKVTGHVETQFDVLLYLRNEKEDTEM